MSETLHIKNFGPIKDVKLDLRKFNVIIGENATGKSTIAKVLAVCRYFSYIMESTPLQSYFEQGLESWGLIEFIKTDSVISYECKHYTFSAERTFFKDIDPETKEIIGEFYFFSTKLVPLSSQFMNLQKELNSIKPEIGSEYGYPNLGWSIPTSFFQNDVAAVLENPLYLPTERGLQSIFSLGKSSIQNISDSLFNQFASLDSIAKNFKDEITIEPLRISYKNEDGRGYIRKDKEDKFYSLYNGASGYKSGIPIVLVIKYYNAIRKKRKTLLIEEPELNLFPVAQKELVNYLVQNVNRYNHSILLTTHSPYILTSLNNLMYAYEIGQKFVEVKEVIEESYWINPEEVSAYKLLQDGTCESIISKSEDGTLIKAETIDEVSKILNKDFDELINIEIKHASEVD